MTIVVQHEIPSNTQENRQSEDFVRTAYSHWKFGADVETARTVTTGDRKTLTSVRCAANDHLNLNSTSILLVRLRR